MHHGANTRGTPAILAPVEINGRTRRTQFQGGIEFLHSFPGYSWTFVQFVESLNIQEALFLLLDRVASFLSFHSKLYISITILYINIRGGNEINWNPRNRQKRGGTFSSIRSRGNSKFCSRESWWTRLRKSLASRESRKAVLTLEFGPLVSLERSTPFARSRARFK